MLLADVNILVGAFRDDAPGHVTCRGVVLAMVDNPLPYAVSDLVLSGFLRVVTHPRIFDPPTPMAAALDFARVYRGQPNAVPVSPGARHWDLFASLCEAGTKGNLVADAYHAALAIETGSEWITADRDFGRFAGLKWRLVELA